MRFLTVLSLPTPTTNPATAIDPEIADPHLRGLGLVFALTAISLVLGGGLGAVLSDLVGLCCRRRPTTAGRSCNRSEMPTTKPESLSTGGQQHVNGEVEQAADFSDLQVHLQLLEVAKASPGTEALTAGACCLSYSGLQDAAASAASALQAAGVSDGVLVALHLQSGVLTVVSIFGTWLAGGAWAPLDWEAPPPRLELLVSEARPQVIVSQKADAVFSPTAVLLLAREADLRLQPVSSAPLEQVPAEMGKPSASNQGPQALAQVIFTSGSTGSPKGVMYSHHRISFACHFFALQCGLTAGVRVLQKTPHIWAVFRHEVFPTLCHGGQLIVAAAAERKDPRRLASLIQNHGVQVLVATPSIMELVAEAGGSLPSLQTAICMGEGVRVEVARKILECAGTQLRLYNFYGSTESENVVYPVPPLGTQAWSDDLSGGSHLPAGWPQPHISLHILDPESLEPKPIGLEGEICFGGILSDGYWRKPELTSAQFLEHPTLGRVYRTGDLGVWDQSCGLRVIGRSDRQVKIRGIRIELEEVEALLLQAARAAGGSEAAVVAAPAQGGGDSSHLALVAFVAPAYPEPPQFSMADVRLESEARMPSYMVPSVMQRVDMLPRLPNQKVDLKALRAMAETATETVQALDSLGMLRVLSRSQVQEDIWLQNMQAFWMLVVMVEHFQISKGVACVANYDCGNLAWRIMMALGHGKDMVAFMLMVGFTDSRDPISFGARDWTILALALLLSGPLELLLSPGYGPLKSLFNPPGILHPWGVTVGHGWFLYSLTFARLLLNLLHRLELRPMLQVLLGLTVAMLVPDDHWGLLPTSLRTWLWHNDTATHWKGLRWSLFFMSAVYLMGFHLGAAVVAKARSWAPSSRRQIGALVGACCCGYITVSLLNASTIESNAYPNFQAVFNEQLSSHYVTWHYMTHPSFRLYVLLWLSEFLLYLLPAFFVAVVMAYSPVHFETIGTTCLGNYVLHPHYIGAPWVSKYFDSPVLTRITSPSLGFANVIITILWNFFFCISFAMTVCAWFHYALVAVLRAARRLGIWLTTRDCGPQVSKSA